MGFYSLLAALLRMYANLPQKTKRVQRKIYEAGRALPVEHHWKGLFVKKRAILRYKFTKFAEICLNVRIIVTEIACKI